jgi:uncharacterized membrane protein YagU involved in acid resistance
VRERRLKNGLTAGFAASAILGVVMLLERQLRFSAGTDPVAVAAGVLGYADEAGANWPVAWLVHFVVGTLAWGPLYGWLAPRMAGAPARRGALFGLLAWLVMMLLVMPLTGAGLFGFAYGLGVPLSLLVMHLVFGVALGLIYARLQTLARR